MKTVPCTKLKSNINWNLNIWNWTNTNIRISKFENCKKKVVNHSTLLCTVKAPDYYCYYDAYLFTVARTFYPTLPNVHNNDNIARLVGHSQTKFSPNTWTHWFEIWKKPYCSLSYLCLVMKWLINLETRIKNMIGQVKTSNNALQSCRATFFDLFWAILLGNL